MTIGEIIKDRRKQLKMTQEDVAKAVGTTKATVSRWESGDIHKVKRSMLEKLANVLYLDPMIFMLKEQVIFPYEQIVLDAYRKADDGTKAAVRKLLDI